MKILVTGCSGFIGRNVVEFFRAGKLHDIYCCNSDIDITDRNEVKEIMCDIKPEAIIHLAAKAVPGDSSHISEKMWQVNVNGTKNLLDFAPEGSRFILSSSITVHGNGKFNVDSPYNPTTIYAASKIAAESLVQSYTNLKRVRGCSMRLCAIVGPGLTHGVIKDFIRKLKTADKLEMLGSWPGSCKPYLHVQDVCGAISDLLYNNISKIILSAENSITIDDIADICMEVMSEYKEKVWLGEENNFVGDNRNVYAEMTKLQNWGWIPSHMNSKLAVKQAVKENL